jgi:hypothetical protein
MEKEDSKVLAIFAFIVIGLVLTLAMFYKNNDTAKQIKEARYYINNCDSLTHVCDSLNSVIFVQKIQLERYDYILEQTELLPENIKRHIDSIIDNTE